MTFKELFLAHLMHKEMRWVNRISLFLSIPLLVFVAFVFPSERTVALIVSYSLWMGWLTFSLPVFYALAKVTPTVKKRHYVFYAVARKRLLALQFLFFLAVSVVWFWGMGLFSMYEPQYGAMLMAIVAISGFGTMTFYHLKYFGKSI